MQITRGATQGHDCTWNLDHLFAPAFSANFAASMTSIETNPRVPGVPQRLAARVRPVGNPVMYQEWRDLLLLHWEYSVAAIQATLPDGLFVDTFGGRAYLGIVPFFMRNIRPRCLPACPDL